MDQPFKNDIIAVVPHQPVGWLETKVNETIMTRLHTYIDTAQEKYEVQGTEAAQGFQHLTSYDLEDVDDWFFKTTLIPLVNAYNQQYPGYEKLNSVLTKNVPYKMNRFWVNFMKEGQSLPAHDHDGVYAFTIWITIPYDWRDQHGFTYQKKEHIKEGTPSNSNFPKASDFEFHYLSILGKQLYHSKYLDKESQGGILFFPAKMMHCVQPFFNNDGTRVSISGNLCYDVS